MIRTGSKGHVRCEEIQRQIGKGPRRFGGKGRIGGHAQDILRLVLDCRKPCEARRVLDDDGVGIGGVKALLKLEEHGASETFVYHNEAGSVFHPKVYLFRNVEEARLIVGSNNMTASGLYSNVEAGLQLDTALTDEVIESALDAMASWRDTTSGFALKLDETLLSKLLDNGYIKEEDKIRPPQRKSKKKSDGSDTEKLFASRTYAPPKKTTKTKKSKSVGSSGPKEKEPIEADPSGTTVLMRLRKARGTQTQIPFRVADKFFKDISQVESVQSGLVHGLNPAKAHNKQNTIKLEIPELKDFDDPYARFEKSGGTVTYEVHDVGSPKGNQIKATLEDGFTKGTTQMSISNKDRATWWRYI
ncbi:hypothetical protein [Roseivivax sp. CAU 1753]